MMQVTDSKDKIFIFLFKITKSPFISPDSFKMPGCFACKKRNASFNFPRDEGGVDRWVEALGLQGPPPPDIKARLCVNHFRPSDYNVTPSGRKLLKPGVLPCNQEELLDILCDDGRNCDDVTHSDQNVDVDTGNYSLDSFIAFVISIVGTLLICFLPFLLSWFSSQSDTPPPAPEWIRTYDDERESKFTPATIKGTYMKLY